MQDTPKSNIDATRLRGLIDPFVEDLGNWRSEVQRLFDRTRGACQGHLIDLAMVYDIEVAREALDWEIEAFEAVSLDLVEEDGAVQLELHDLGGALRSLQRAANLLADQIDHMRADEERRDIIDAHAFGASEAA
ncbi:MAG: hypothetical protein ABI377_07260 [Devosia sp.]